MSMPVPEMHPTSPLISAPETWAAPKVDLLHSLGPDLQQINPWVADDEFLTRLAAIYPDSSPMLCAHDVSGVSCLRVSILALKWLFTAAYEAFTQSQPLFDRLEVDSFHTLRADLLRHIATPDD